MARKMKDSGIEWIGEIPEGWELTKVKRIFDIGRGRVISQQELTSVGYPVYSSQTKNNGCLGYISTYDFDKSQLTWTTDGVNAGTVFLREGKHNCTNVCGTLAPKNDTNDLRYLKYALEYIAFYHKRADINGFKIMNNEMAEIELLLPPLFEQQNIANYLDFKCSQTQSILEQSLFSIEEYKKLKQAVITQAVTKGVRGEREMKDSGVEWIGEIPKEWRKTQLRHCATIKSGITLGKSYRKDTVLIERPYLRVANVQGGYVDLNDLATIEVTPDEDLKYRLHSGDVLMTEGGDRDKLGRGCVWHGEIEPCLHQNHVFAVQTNETILLPEFLEYLTASDVGRSYFDVTAIKTTNLACTSSSKVLAFTIPLPPIEEQIEIVNFIKKRSLELNKLIMKKELLVQELESYKKSLIYEFVTGKREV